MGDGSSRAGRRTLNLEKSTLEVVIKRNLNILKEITAVELSATMDLLYLKDLRQHEVAKVDKIVSTTHEKLDKYVKTDEASNELVG